MIDSALSTLKDFSKHQVIRFLIVGVASFMVEFLVFVFLVDVVDIKYTHANLPAMALAIIFNYFLTKGYVFESIKYNARTTFLLFITFTLLGVGLNQFLLWFFVEQATINIKLSKILAVALVAIFNYFTKKHFVF
jgi:putative flippase GtrA